MTVGYLAATVTFGFIALGVLGKWLAHGWRWSDLYLGMPMALAAISGSFLYCFELIRQVERTVDAVARQELSNIMVGNQLFLVAALFVYLGIAVIHKTWENDNEQSWRESIFLIGIANALGAATLASFILYVKAH